MFAPLAAGRKTVPLLNLQAQYEPIREEVMAATTRVVNSQHFILGEEVRQLEEEIAAYSNPATRI